MSRTTTTKKRPLSQSQLRLYFARGAPNSALAVKNILSICKQQHVDVQGLELIDVLQEPERALHDGIFVTPTLVKVSPEPVVTIIGDLSATVVVMQALGLPIGEDN